MMRSKIIVLKARNPINPAQAQRSVGWRYGSQKWRVEDTLLLLT